MYFYTLRDIEPGEELLVWYGDAYATQLGLSTEEGTTRGGNQEEAGSQSSEVNCSSDDQSYTVRSEKAETPSTRKQEPGKRKRKRLSAHARAAAASARRRRRSDGHVSDNGKTETQECDSTSKAKKPRLTLRFAQLPEKTWCVDTIVPSPSPYETDHLEEGSSENERSPTARNDEGLSWPLQSLLRLVTLLPPMLFPVESAQHVADLHRGRSHPPGRALFANLFMLAQKCFPKFENHSLGENFKHLLAWQASTSSEQRTFLLHAKQWVEAETNAFNETTENGEECQPRKYFLYQAESLITGWLNALVQKWSKNKPNGEAGGHGTKNHNCSDSDDDADHEQEEAPRDETEGVDTDEEHENYGNSDDADDGQEETAREEMRGDEAIDVVIDAMDDEERGEETEDVAERDEERNTSDQEGEEEPDHQGSETDAEVVEKNVCIAAANETSRKRGSSLSSSLSSFLSATSRSFEDELPYRTADEVKMKIRSLSLDEEQLEECLVEVRRKQRQTQRVRDEHKIEYDTLRTKRHPPLYVLGKCISDRLAREKAKLREADGELEALRAEAEKLVQGLNDIWREKSAAWRAWAQQVAAPNED